MTRSHPLAVFAFVALTRIALPALGADAPLTVAHRGASADAPENTLPAFRLAWRQNADAIEGDFHLTADGHIVCIHDANAKKTTGADLLIHKTTLDRLRRLDAGATFHPRFTGTRIPTLDEVIETVPPGKKLYIEVKCGPEILPVLMPKLEASGLSEDQIVLISFNDDVVRQFKQRAKPLKAYWLKGFKENQPAPPASEILATLRESRADGLSSNTHIPDDLVRAVQAQGYEHHVWTVNDPATADRFEQLGTRSITTDTPAQIKNRHAQ
ncbi:MAG: glycerophosphodiester phosphodiesterase [Planctomycetota bacterium]